MITKEQYEQLIPHREALELMKRSGEWVGGSDIFSLRDNITGKSTNMNCDGCKGEALIDSLNMIKQYENRNMWSM